MKNTIKFVALGACALAASSSAALAGSELPKGITTGLSIGMPLPEGVYDISIGSYGSQGARWRRSAASDAYAIPVWLVWWTPWQIAGGRVMFDTATGVADSWTKAPPLTVPIAGSIRSSKQASAGTSAMASARACTLARGYPAPRPFRCCSAATTRRSKAPPQLATWQVAGTFRLRVSTAQAVTKRMASYGAGTAQQADWFNLDLTAVKHYGKYETGLVAYGSWDLSDSGFTHLPVLHWAGKRMQAEPICCWRPRRIRLRGFYCPAQADRGRAWRPTTPARYRAAR